jgi:hypothetical protein
MGPYTWLVTYCNGATVKLFAFTEDDAIYLADEQADDDGYPGLKAVRAERMD